MSIILYHFTKGYQIVHFFLICLQCCTKLVIVYKSELCTPKPANIWSNNDTTVTDYCRHALRKFIENSPFYFQVFNISNLIGMQLTKMYIVNLDFTNRHQYSRAGLKQQKKILTSYWFVEQHSGSSATIQRKVNERITIHG